MPINTDAKRYRFFDRFGHPFFKWLNFGGRTFSSKMGVGNLGTTPFLVASMSFFIFCAVLASPWRNLDATWEGFGLHFWGFGLRFPTTLIMFQNFLAATRSGRELLEKSGGPGAGPMGAYGVPWAPMCPFFIVLILPRANITCLKHGFWRRVLCARYAAKKKPLGKCYAQAMRGAVFLWWWIGPPCRME